MLAVDSPSSVQSRRCFFARLLSSSLFSPFVRFVTIVIQNEKRTLKWDNERTLVGAMTAEDEAEDDDGPDGDADDDEADGDANLKLEKSNRTAGNSESVFIISFICRCV